MVVLEGRGRELGGQVCLCIHLIPVNMGILHFGLSFGGILHGMSIIVVEAHIQLWLKHAGLKKSGHA